MFARVTQFEIDTLRISLDDALERFKQTIVPEVRNLPGYRGLYVMRTPEGKGVVLSLWDTAEAAQRGVESGYYEQAIANFIMVVKQPPGRDHYEVVFSEEKVPT